MVTVIKLSFSGSGVEWAGSLQVGQLFEKTPVHKLFLQPLEDMVQVLTVDSQVPVTLTHVLGHPQDQRKVT